MRLVNPLTFSGVGLAGLAAFVYAIDTILHRAGIETRIRMGILVLEVTVGLLGIAAAFVFEVIQPA